MKEITYEIKKHIGTLTTDKAEIVRKEINIVSWNGNKPRYEIRSWKYMENEKEALKGIVLQDDELKALKEI